MDKNFYLSPWEPVAELEYQALDTDCNPMKNDPDEPQNYGCTVIGFCLDDSEGCRSIMDITTGEGRAKDEELARLVIEGLRSILPDMTDAEDEEDLLP